MDIMHGVSTCRPTTPRGMVRIVLAYVQQGKEPTVVAYQAIASDFDSIALRSIAEEHKKTGHSYTPNIAVHVGLVDEVAKMAYIDRDSGWRTSDQRNASRETPIEKQIKTAILQAKKLCYAYETTGRKPPELSDVMKRVAPKSIMCVG